MYKYQISPTVWRVLLYTFYNTRNKYRLKKKKKKTHIQKGCKNAREAYKVEVLI